MAKGWQARARARRKARREERYQRNEDRKDRRAARTLAKRQQRFDFRLSKQTNRIEGRNTRVQIRQSGHTDRVQARQNARLGIKEAKFHADEVAYENGIDPNQWKASLAESVSKGASSLGESITSIWSGRKNGGIQNLVDIPEEGSKSGGNKNILIIGVTIVLIAVASFFGLNGKGKKRKK